MPPELLVELKKLQYQRSDNSPFSNRTKFSAWADAVMGLLSSDPSLHKRFRFKVDHAKFQFGADLPTTEAVNECIGVLNEAVTTLQLASSTKVETTAASTQSQPAAHDSKLKAPLTLKWVYENATWRVYALFIGAVAAAFLAGREVGKIEMQIQTSNLSKPAPTTTTPTNTMNSSKEPTRPEVKSHIASAPK